MNATSGSAAVTPSISSVSPNPVPGSDGGHTFTVNGSNFATGANITLRDATTGEIFTNRKAMTFSNTEITLNVNFTTAPHDWCVEVINPDGQSSGEFYFSVTAPQNAADIATGTLPGVSILLYVIAWLSLGVGIYMFLKLFDTYGGRYTGGYFLASGVIAFAVFFALARILTLVTQIAAKSK